MRGFHTDKRSLLRPVLIEVDQHRQGVLREIPQPAFNDGRRIARKAERHALGLLLDGAVELNDVVSEGVLKVSTDDPRFVHCKLEQLVGVGLSRGDYAEDPERHPFLIFGLCPGGSNFGCLLIVLLG